MQPFYTLIIRDNKYVRYKKLASALFLVNAIIFIILALRSDAGTNKLLLFSSAFIGIAYSVYNWSFRKKKERSYVILYLLIAATWVGATPFWYFSILLLVLLVFQSRLESDFIIVLSAHQVVVNGFMINKYRWQDFNNIVLKDALLTLDFKNNRILQVEPDWNLSTPSAGIRTWDFGEGYPATEKEFNDFCNQQLRAAASTI